MWGGAHVELTAPPAGREGLGSRPVPQVGFERRDRTGWDYFTESELREAGDLRARFETEWEAGVKHVVAPTQDVHERLMALMREHGVPLKGKDLESGITPEGMGEASVAWIFDLTLARAIAKIAFNYLAKTQGAEFARRPEFDAVRQFIREGEGRPPYFVQPQEGPVVEHRFGGPPPRCHVITLYWAEDQPWILCRLSPFNHHAYLVRLCTDLRGPLVREVKSGHLFDLDTLEARQLERTRIAPPEGHAF
jgi:hypothetical protein